MDLIKEFYKIRDIPYRIPLSLREKDRCCSGKHKLLYNKLKKKDYKVRYRVCLFLWKSVKLPKYVEKIPHDKDCTHTYLEINLGKGWKILDATWDSNLKKLFQ